jgi:predicted transposase/invertase (TIGR01784 family)
VVHTIKLKNQNGKTFYEKLTYIYLEMPNFKMAETELNSRLDQWLFFIKNLEDFQSIPSIFSDEIFTKAFEKAELAKFGQGDLDSYENSLKIYRDLKGVIDTAFDEGKQEGRIEIAKSLKENSVPIEIISKTTGLSKDQIDQL